MFTRNLSFIALYSDCNGFHDYEGKVGDYPDSHNNLLLHKRDQLLNCIYKTVTVTIPVCLKGTCKNITLTKLVKNCRSTYHKNAGSDTQKNFR